MCSIRGSAGRQSACRLTFELHEYRRGFFREVTLEISVDDVSRSWHVPLLIAPFGVSSYRGS